MHAEKLTSAETFQGYTPRNEREAVYDDSATWLAEVLDGQMRTEFSFGFDSNDLIGKDGRKFGEIFDTSIVEAEAIARVQPELAFELRRRKLEKAEHTEMLAMMRGELPNTMVVISDFPPELTNARTDVGGYNTRRQQTMMRVISRQKDGTLLVQTQSLDGSNRAGLESIYAGLQAVPQPGELLGQRVHLDLPEVWQPELINNLTDKYDETLRQRIGGDWYGGRRPADFNNTYDFVLAQTDLLNVFVDAKLRNPQHAEKMRYGLAAAFESRFRNRLNAKSTIGEVGADMTVVLVREMQLAEGEALQSGKTFSGCGITKNGTAEELEAIGYGNQSQNDKYGSLKFKCQKGHENTRPKNKLIDKCKTCGISVRC